MSKKRKNVVPEEITEKAQMYLDLWMSLNKAKEELEIDTIRVRMTELWVTMSDGDKRDFHRESNLYERKNKIK